MIRTQVSLDEKEYALAKKDAASLASRSQNCSAEAFLMLAAPSNQKPWMRYAGMVESGDSKSSQHIDDIFYGTKG